MIQRASYILRPHEASDMDWVAHRHKEARSGVGFNEEFESMVAGIVADFTRNYDPKRECCWIAEMDGEPVACVFLVKKSDTVAQLRLMLVEPKARGLGIGERLVEECVTFARKADYQKIVLWTNDVAVAARHVYEKAGFRLVHSEPHHIFGRDLVDETWELSLSPT